MLSSQKAFRKNELEDLIEWYALQFPKLSFPLNWKMLSDKSKSKKNRTAWIEIQNFIKGGE